MAESFFATIRTEWIEGWYNTRRHHSSLGYLSPAAYETNRDTTTANAVA